MQTFRVLIVDDQRDVRRVLRDGILTLNADIDVIDVPSGEEAILVISRQPIDLIIVDIRLPGISGLELMERAQIRNPNMKFVLITGMDSEKIRDEVARSGADAYFYKPISISEFLDYVQGCLSSVKHAHVESEEVADEVDKDESDISAPSLSDHLSSLRQELETLCVILIDEHGQIMAQAGNLPELDDDEGFIASLMAAFSSAVKVSYSLELDQPQDLLYFAGQGKGYILAHVGPSLGLMLAIEVSGWEDERTWSSMRSIPNRVQDLLSVLIDMGVYSEQRPEPEFPETVEIEEEASAEAALTELDAIFKQAKKKIKPEDVDAFWDSATAEKPDELTRTDAISYEQARQLGLAPEEK
jgi:DNA-binding response OmpR family regulator